MIRCRIYSCKRYPYQPCCEGCRDADTCEARCKNHPSRCKCAAEGALPCEDRKQFRPAKPRKKPPPDRPVSRPGARTIDWTLIQRLRDLGWSLSRIAAETGTTPAYVSRVLKKIRQLGGDPFG